MPDILPQQFMQTLKSYITAKDQVKTRLIMAHYSEMDEKTQRMALLELSHAPDEFVFQVLVTLLADTNQDKEDSTDISELLFSKALDNPQLLTYLLIREVKPQHRMVLAEIAGEIKLEDATPVMLSILTEERDEKILRSIITALGMIGDPSATTPISEYLYSGSVELIIAAIHALGMLATPTAIQRLAEKLGSDQDLDTIIINVFANSQAPEAIERLNACLSAQWAHLRNAGKQRLIAMGPKAVPILINNLHYDDPDLLIHTLNVLGAIGDESAISPIRKMLHNQPKDANVRFAAYEALGLVPVAKGAFALAQGLNDPVGNVRAAAAEAINHNYNTVLAAGIKNMIRDEDPAQRLISRTIIDTKCDTIFLDLFQEAPFRTFATEYLCHEAHRDIRNHYVTILHTNGLKETADSIQSECSPPMQEPLKVFAIDDSKLILNIYRSVLHNLGCEPILFEFPAEAIKQVSQVNPDFIFTDLNMPDISGIDVTRAVREHYTKEQLPIVMVTTQNECQDNEAALQAGVNIIINKPFDEKMLRNVLQEQLKSV